MQWADLQNYLIPTSFYYGVTHVILLLYPLFSTSPEAILNLYWYGQGTCNSKQHVHVHVVADTQIPLYFLGQEGQLYNVHKGSVLVLPSSPDSSLH